MWCLISEHTCASAHTEQLLVLHLKLRQRNGRTIDAIIELGVAHNKESNDVLDEVLKKNESLVQEMQSIRRENLELKNRLKLFQSS